jgi:hypothetical protein
MKIQNEIEETKRSRTTSFLPSDGASCSASLGVSDAERKPRSLKEIAAEYFADHPEEKDGVMKVYHAYHVAHFRLDGGAHNFLSSSRTCECFWCGRTRQDVRWDDLPPECQNRPSDADLGIGEVLESEEKKAHAIYEKAKVHVPRLVKKMGMSGETLATLHHTHGYDPETVSGVVEVPPEVMTAYNASMETERDRSRKAIVREVISCVFDDSLANEKSAATGMERKDHE